MGQGQLETVWKSAATNNYILNPVAVSPDGKLAATLGTANTVQIWNMADGVPVQALPGHTLWVGDLAFSPDGKLLASGGGDRSVRVWRTEDWSLIYTLQTTHQGPPVVFSPDSATLAVGNGKNVELHHAGDGAGFQSWEATAGQLKALAFSPDGNTLASGAGIRGTDTTLKLWQIPGGALLHTVPTGQTYGIGRVTFSPDGREILTGSDYLYSGAMQAWRVADGTFLRAYPLASYAMSYSPDGTVLAAVGTNIMFFRAADGALIESYDDAAAITPGPKGIAISPVNGLFIRSRGLGEVAVARVPLVISPPSLTGGLMLLRWVGGAGPYQVQRSTDPAGPWLDEGGPVATNAVEISTTASRAFYRVVSPEP